MISCKSYEVLLGTGPPGRWSGFKIVYQLRSLLPKEVGGKFPEKEREREHKPRLVSGCTCAHGDLMAPPTLLEKLLPKGTQALYSSYMF